MILALLTIYVAICYLVFYKFKWVKADWKSQLVVVVVGSVLIIALLFVCNYYQPYSTDVRVAQYTVPVVPRVTGRVVDVPVQPNVPIQEGDILFRIDPEPYEYEVRRLEAQLELRKSEVAQMEEALKAAVAGVAIAKADLVVLRKQQDAAKANVDAADANLVLARDEIRVAEADVDRGRAELEVQELQFAREKKLVEDNVEPEARLDELRRGLMTRKAALDAAEARLIQVRDAVAVRQAQRATAQATYEQTKAQEDKLRAALQQAEASRAKVRLALAATIDGKHASVQFAEQQLATARWKLENTVIRAPADGFVTQVQLKPGAVATILPMNAVMVFVYDEKFLVATFWPNAMRHVEVGQPVDIALDALPGTLLKGTVTQIGPVSGQGQAAPTGTLRGWSPGQPADRAALRIDFEGEPPGINVAAGGGGAIAVYPGKFTGTKIIRRVIINAYSWLNYVFN